MSTELPDTDEARDGDPEERTLGGRYRLVKVVGSGGMGEVWEAVSTWTGRRVAVKITHPRAGATGGAGLSPDAAERCLREAQATARVRHPNVVDVLDMGSDPESGGLFIVYELLEGETLRVRLDRQRRLTPDEAAEVLVPVMEGLAAAHRQSVVHRDLKPENVFLARGPDGGAVPRLIDFGIARIDDPELIGLTRTGAALGTAHYMSPEQARGARDLDARSDIWSLGVIWFEALSGARPYEGSSYNEVLAKILTEDPAALSGVPRPLAAVIGRALARDRDARHATVDGFVAALRAALRAPGDVAPERPSRRRSLLVACSAALAIGASVAAAAGRQGAPAPAVAAERDRRVVALAAVAPPQAAAREGSGAPRAAALAPVEPQPRSAHLPPARGARGGAGEVVRHAIRHVDPVPAPGAPPARAAPVNGALVLEP